MFRPIRRKKKEISPEAVKELLHTCRRGVLAVNGDDGYPYAIPINYLYDEENNKIFFHGSRVGHKIDAIRACDKVCFTIYGDEIIKDEPWAPYLQSVVVFGRCKLIEDTEESLQLIHDLAMKFFPSEDLVEEEIRLAGKAVQMFAIEIEHMTGKELQER